MHLVTAKIRNNFCVHAAPFLAAGSPWLVEGERLCPQGGDAHRSRACMAAYLASATAWRAQLCVFCHSTYYGNHQEVADPIGQSPMAYTKACVSSPEDAVRAYRITAWSGLEGTSVGLLVQPPAKAGSPTAGCTGSCAGGSWISPEKETPQPPWAACSRAPSPSEGRSSSSCSDGTFYASICAHCPLSCLWALLKKSLAPSSWHPPFRYL